MSEENFKKCVYIVLALLILVFYTKDIDFFYKKVKDIKNPDSLMVLVNKLNRLQSNYVPHDLEQISLNYATNNKFLRKEAKENFEKLVADNRIWFGENGDNVPAVKKFITKHQRLIRALDQRRFIA